MENYKEELTLWYTVREDGKEIQEIQSSLNNSGGLHMDEFYRFCRNFALAVGYSEKTVNKYFGEARIDEDEWA